MPDFRGLFLRGHGAQTHVQENGGYIGITATNHASGELGVVQGDAIRPGIQSLQTHRKANNNGGIMDVTADGGDDVYRYDRGSGGTDGIGVNGARGWRMIYSRQIIANENRPANMAVRYLIRATQ